MPSEQIMNPDTLRNLVAQHYPFGFSLSPFEGPRFHPSLQNQNTNPAQLKDVMLKENLTFSAKLHAFNNNYHRYASEILEMGSLLQNHALDPSKNNRALQESLDILRKENLELKKRIEQLTRGKH
jgi:hypothetical protein